MPRRNDLEPRSTQGFDILTTGPAVLRSATWRRLEESGAGRVFAGTLAAMREPEKRTAAKDVEERGVKSVGLPFAADAGDLDLIRWCLSLSPDERLAALQDFVDTFWTPAHG